ncbi:MAG: aminoglycoside 6'-N-acetyltransferase [Casimicrobiaceae bacterium]
MIRPCTAPELPGWLELRLALWPHHDPQVHLGEMAQFCAAPARYGQFIAHTATGDSQGFVEVALRSDYVNGTRSSPVAFLEEIYVKPESRRRGVARSLVAVAEDWARSRGCTEFASDASLANEASHTMHRALGFEETQRVVYFRKSLVRE